LSPSTSLRFRFLLGNPQKREEVSKTIVELTGIAQPIHVSYRFEESTNDAGPLDSPIGGVCWLDGTAIKRKNAMWSITLVNGDEMTRTSEEMLSSLDLYIQNACTELNESERKRTVSKKKRIQKTERRKRDKEYIQLARVKQQEDKRKQFDTMMESIEGGAFEFSDFEDLVTRMREPFSCEVGEGVEVQVTPDDAAVMFDRAALMAIKRVLVMEGSEGNNDGQPPKKKRRNAAAVETGFRVGCNGAHHHADQRDRTQNANAKAEQLKRDLKEKDAIVEILTAFDKRKEPHFKALRAWRDREREGVFPHPWGPHIPFWLCQESDKNLFRLFLRMYLPKYGHGFLGAKPAAQWIAMQTKITGTVDLTESSFNAKGEELRRNLRTVKQSIIDNQPTVRIDEASAAMNT
jgi:hypothetical protein